jgi:hypothetical protein
MGIGYSFNRCRQKLGFPDILTLRVFVSAAQKHDYDRPLLRVVDTVAWAIMDPKLTDSFAYGLHIAGIAQGQPAYAGEDTGLWPPESRSFANHLAYSSVCRISIIAVRSL